MARVRLDILVDPSTKKYLQLISKEARHSIGKIIDKLVLDVKVPKKQRLINERKDLAMQITRLTEEIDRIEKYEEDAL